MCGIFCIIADEVDSKVFYEKYAEELLKNRGPNNEKTIYKNEIRFTGTQLYHQGNAIQPINDDGVILLFNGDLYMNEVQNSDTEYLFDKIRNCQNEDEFLKLFSSIIGPFSIICYFNNSLYIGRDSLGRNSLIIGKYDNSIFCSSVIQDSADINSIELPSLGIYKINTDSLDLFPYQKITHDYSLEQLNNLEKIINVSVIEKNINPEWLQQSRVFYNYSFNEIVNSTSIDLFNELLTHSEIAKAGEKFIDLLSNSVKQRVERTQNKCKICFKFNNVNCLHSHISILFSGGIDCSLICLLADKFIAKDKQIDLLNVAFEKVSNKNEIIDFNVPDRITGLSSFNELKNLCPDRKWNFVQINIQRSELLKYKKKLSSLIYPLDSVLDESLGSALYFASRGKGVIDNEEYESPCRVILIGSGADEIFGGYTRHRNAFKRSTPENDLLKYELDYDWIRLPSRNLARDDRVIGDNGVTVRAPFIEENFVNFARSLTPLQRCYPKLDEGIGDKLLLRLSAYKLGLKNCCQFKKRAIQFGSKIANKKEGASNKSKLLQRE